MSFKRPREGDPITPDLFTDLYDALDAGPKVVPPLVVGSDGSIGLAEEPGFWVQFTGAPSSGKHPWKRVFPGSGGTWSDGSQVGTTAVDPAYEINGNTATLTGKRARAWRDRTSGEVRFAYSVCS